mgnify:FL=1
MEGSNVSTLASNNITHIVNLYLGTWHDNSDNCKFADAFAQELVAMGLIKLETVVLSTLFHYVGNNPIVDKVLFRQTFEKAYPNAQLTL